MNNLRHSGNARAAASRQVLVIRSIIDDLERTLKILRIDIQTEEERVRIFDKADPTYPILARMLGARVENLKTTVADLKKRLASLTVTEGIAEAA
jgi:hypothetical protein